MDDAEKQLNKMVRRFKSNLTRAKKTGRPREVLAAANAALREFRRTGLWPDCWSLWERAKTDAEFDIQRGR